MHDLTNVDPLNERAARGCSISCSLSYKLSNTAKFAGYSGSAEQTNLVGGAPSKRPPNDFLLDKVLLLYEYLSGQKWKKIFLVPSVVHHQSETE